MNQDLIQKFSVFCVVLVELYRVMVSSLLILFVPQDCNGHMCTYSENLEAGSRLYVSGLVINFSTLGVFILMYAIELIREFRLIAYLHVNSALPCDNDSVGNILDILPLRKKNRLLCVDKYYQVLGALAILFFIVNTILSGFVIYSYYLDSNTTTTYVTNILFMIFKLIDVLTNVRTEKNVFISAYLKGKIQYNDIDPDVKNKLSEIEMTEKNKIFI